MTLLNSYRQAKAWLNTQPQFSSPTSIAASTYGVSSFGTSLALTMAAFYVALISNPIPQREISAYPSEALLAFAQGGAILCAPYIGYAVANLAWRTALSHSRRTLTPKVN
jgi:hypothetical protein